MQKLTISLLVIVHLTALAVPSAAQNPAPDAAVDTFEARCRNGVRFRWRAERPGEEFRYSTGAVARLPCSDAAGNPMTYTIEVDAAADFWHRFRFQERNVHYEAGRVYEFEASSLEVDASHLLGAALLASGAVAAAGAWQYLRARSAPPRRSRVPARLSESEARAILFPDDGSTPDWIDGYEVVDELGTGGMAVVYRVRRDNREYALKLPFPVLLDDENYRARFAREMRLARCVSHPNVVRIHEVNDGQGDFGYPYLVMELIEGRTLRDVAREKRLDVEAVGLIGLPLLDALSHLHGNGIVHRDIKPGNIIITGSGGARLMDFGIARREGTLNRVTATGDLLGTPLYLAPEQIAGDCPPTDPRADIYGLGVVLYEVLAGRTPWTSDDSADLSLEKLRSEAPSLLDARPELPPALVACVMRMITRDPEDRYQTAEDAAAALRQALP